MLSTAGPEGAEWDSPGRSPGKPMPTRFPPWKGGMARGNFRPARSVHWTDPDFALSGLILCLMPRPRAKPWAITCGPFRARSWHRLIDGLTMTTQSKKTGLRTVSG